VYPIERHFFVDSVISNLNSEIVMDKLRIVSREKKNFAMPFAIRLRRGFSLLEVAIVLVVAGLGMGMVLKFYSGIQDTQKRATIRAQLDAIDLALANFVATNKRLPCPANGTLASAALGAGTETISPGPPPVALPPKGTCNPATQVNGVVPWIALGLTEADTTDPWGGRIMYRVDPQLAQGAPLTLLMNMSDCDPSSTGAVGAGGICQVPVPSCTGTAGCTSPSNFLAGKGLDVWNGVGAAIGWAARQNNRALGTGAAYVIISQGVSGTAAYNSGGILQPGSIAAGTDEAPNRNGIVLAIPSAQGTTYRDAALNDRTTAIHFDDYLSHPTIISVLNKANLGPRAH
jgi:prepilin-type N-terminal cleavage/methylation domain-containing protein